MIRESGEHLSVVKPHAEIEQPILHIRDTALILNDYTSAFHPTIQEDYKQILFADRALYTSIGRGGFSPAECITSYWKRRLVMNRAANSTLFTESIKDNSTLSAAAVSLLQTMFAAHTMGEYINAMSDEDQPATPAVCFDLTQQLLDTDKEVSDGEVHNKQAARLAQNAMTALGAHILDGQFETRYEADGLPDFGRMLRTNLNFTSRAISIYLATVLSGKKGLARSISKKLAVATDYDRRRNGIDVQKAMQVNRVLREDTDALPKEFSGMDHRQSTVLIDVAARNMLLSNLSVNLERLGEIDPSEVRKHARRYIEFTHDRSFYEAIGGGEELWRQRLEEREAHNKPDTKPLLDLEKFRPMHVNWEPLPPGQLKEAAERIVDKVIQRRSNHRKAPAIDLGRLDILETVRTDWEKNGGSAYYVQGTLKERGHVHDKEKQIDLPDEYILLVLRKYAEDGKTAEYEQVVADSPIVGDHGVYVYRPDVFKHRFPDKPDMFSAWERVMSGTKPQARGHTARSLQHRAPKDHDMVRYMTDKINALLDCSVEDFHLRFDAHFGVPVLRKMVRIVPPPLAQELSAST